MRKFLPLLILLCATLLFAQNRVVGYFPHWAQYSQFTPADVRYNLLTEIRYGYVVPSGSELVFMDDGDKSNFLDLVKRAKDAKIKVIVSVGGLGNEEAMKEAYSNSAGFVRAAAAFKNEYGIDGFELDGGTVDASGAEELVKLAKELAGTVPASIAIPGEAVLASALGDIGKIDAVSLWFTDAASANDASVRSNSDNAFNAGVLAAFASAGVAKNKLFPIVPFYGKTFYKANGLGSAHEGTGSGNDGVLPYKDIMEKFNKKDAYSVSFDEVSKSEVAVSESEAIVFNGIPSMQAITKTVKDNGYGGVAVFDISGDRREPIISLLVTIGQILRPEIDYKKKR